MSDPIDLSLRWQVVHGDAADVLSRISPDHVGAIVTDPPYGMDWDTDSTRFTGGTYSRGDGRDDWGAVSGDAEPFDPAPILALNVPTVLWGANHYAARLPVGTTLVWLKRNLHLLGTFLSDAEVAWMRGGHGVYVHYEQFPPPSRMAEAGGSVAHPCQKPIALGMWCIAKVGAEPGSLIVDPYCGSGSFGVSALRMGCRYLGVEREADKVAVARRRVGSEAAQGSLAFGG